MQENNEIMEAKKDLINLYLILRPKKLEEVIFYYIKYYYNIQEEKSSEKQKEEDFKKLNDKPIKDIIEYIKVSIDIIVSIKVDEELKKYNQDNPNSAIEYETLLQKEEEAIRQHISTEHQLKIQCEKYVEKIDDLENEKNILINEIVSNYFNLLFILIEKRKRKIQ